MAARAKQAELQAQADAAAQREADARALTAAVMARQALHDAEEQARVENERRAAIEKARLAQATLDEENRKAAQLAAETSPNNHCKEPKPAGALLVAFNSLAHEGEYAKEAIDIEHLTTMTFDASTEVMTCHGAFVLTTGQRVVGTLETRRNIAGNLIAFWHRD